MRAVEFLEIPHIIILERQLRRFDGFLVRGYAFAISSGTGTLSSEGMQTCQSNLKMEAHKSVIEWFAGKALAYTDKTGNITSWRR